MNENPLESLSVTIPFSPRDWGIEKRDAWVYGIVCGWDDDCRAEFEKKFGWDDATFSRLNRLHERFEEMRRAQSDHIGDVTAMITQPDNEPLTLDDLWGMEGEPAYSQKEDLWVLITINEYGPVLVFKDGSRCFASDWMETDCGPLYRRKPEPEGGAR